MSLISTMYQNDPNIISLKVKNCNQTTFRISLYQTYKLHCLAFSITRAVLIENILLLVKRFQFYN